MLIPVPHQIDPVRALGGAPCVGEIPLLSGARKSLHDPATHSQRLKQSSISSYGFMDISPSTTSTLGVEPPSLLSSMADDRLYQNAAGLLAHLTSRASIVTSQ